MLEVLDRRKPQEEEMWNDRRVHGLVEDREEMKEYLEHENLENDKKAMRQRRRIWSDFIEVSPKTKRIGLV